MARYRKIDTRIWSDAKFRKLSDNARLLWFYLLTNPGTSNLPGLYRAGKASICEDLNWTMKGFAEGFGELQAKGLVRVDWDARLLWIPNAIKYNPPENPNVVKSWRTAWDELPECSLKTAAFCRLEEFTKGLGKGFHKAFGESCPKGMANQDQDQEQDQEQYLFETTYENGTDILSGPDLVPDDIGDKPVHRVSKKNGKSTKSPKGWTDAPDSIIPGKGTLQTAESLGVLWEMHWFDCRDWHLKNGKQRKDWNATLRDWMRSDLSKGKHPKINAQQPLIRTDVL